VVLNQPKQKAGEIPSQPIAGHNGTCLSYQVMWKVEIEGIMAPGQSAKTKQNKKPKNDLRHHLNGKSWAWRYTSHSSYSTKSIMGGSQSRPACDKNKNLAPK
jgi:hypothetical protein